MMRNTCARRPCEGIARQIRTKVSGARSAYSFFRSKARPRHRLLVAPDLERVRPYVAACTAVGYEVTAAGLTQLIQVQEKLADIYGRKRQTVSIGLYRLAEIVFPINYALVKPDVARFTPLGFDEKMTPREILAVHPKGLEYGSILAGCERVPLLLDTEGQVLSLPPIINSREIGEIHVGDRALLVEVTGTDLPMPSSRDISFRTKGRLALMISCARASIFSRSSGVKGRSNAKS